MTVGTLRSYIAESILTLEAVMRRQRRGFLDENKPQVDVVEVSVQNGKSFSVEVGPDASTWPGMSPVLGQYLTDAVGLGVKMLRAPRIGGIINPEIPSAYYVLDAAYPAEERQARTFAVMDHVEFVGSNIAWIKMLVANYAHGKTWHQAVDLVPTSEEGCFADAVPEWVDGDSVTAHNGYSNF